MVTASAVAEAAAWNILVVEDDAPVRDSLRLVLETSGYSVSTAATGEEALSLINKNSYDIVLCDLRLPGISGLNVINRSGGRCPVSS